MRISDGSSDACSSDLVFAIEIDGQACGGIGVRPGQDERRHTAELGYWLGRAHWGRGHMTRIVGAFAPWVMGALSLYRLQATVLDFNAASAQEIGRASCRERVCMYV